MNHMNKFDELESSLEAAKLCYRTRLIEAINNQNRSIEELSYIVQQTEGMLYKIISGRENPWPELMADLSVVLNVPVGELFPEVEADGRR
jgi:transcriptional regulator with XRE-family HTH domain